MTKYFPSQYGVSRLLQSLDRKLCCADAININKLECKFEDVVAIA